MEHHQLHPGNSRRRRRPNDRSRSESPITKIGHRQQFRLLLRAVIQFNFPLALSSQLLGTSLSKLTRKQRKDQFEQGHLINVVLDYALNSNYSVSMYCAYLVLSEMNFNSNVLNLRHAGKIDGEHPITGMLRYFALIKRARPQRSDGTFELRTPLPRISRHGGHPFESGNRSTNRNLPIAIRKSWLCTTMVSLRLNLIDCRHRVGSQMPNRTPIIATKKLELQQTRSKIRTSHHDGPIPQRPNGQS